MKILARLMVVWGIAAGCCFGQIMSTTQKGSLVPGHSVYASRPGSPALYQLWIMDDTNCGGVHNATPTQCRWSGAVWQPTGAGGSGTADPTLVDYGADPTGAADSTTAIQAAVTAMLNGTIKALHASKGTYKVTGTIHFGTTTASFNSGKFYGDGMGPNCTSSATCFKWAGAANGTVFEATSMQESYMGLFTIDCSSSAGIGLLNDAKNSGGGSNHNNTFDSIQVVDVLGTPGIGVLNSGNQFSLTDQDVCCSRWLNIRTYNSVEGIKVEGAQSVSHTFDGGWQLYYTSRGFDLTTGGAKIYNMSFTSVDPGANVDDVYVSSLAGEFHATGTYHEVNSSSNPGSRHAFNFPGTFFGRDGGTSVSNAYIQWLLTSGAPIYYEQNGPIKIASTSISTGGGTGTGAITVHSSYTNGSCLMLENDLGTNASYSITSPCTSIDHGVPTYYNTAVAFASLPACATALDGNRRPIIDSTTATWGATITGGSTNHVMAYCNGTNWTVATK